MLFWGFARVSRVKARQQSNTGLALGNSENSEKYGKIREKYRKVIGTPITQDPHPPLYPRKCGCCWGAAAGSSHIFWGIGGVGILGYGGVG